MRVTLSSICSSDLHIKHGSVPRAVPGITVGHEMVGIVEQVGSEVKTVFVISLLNGETLENAHAKAVEVSAYVCTRHGAINSIII